MTSDSVAGFLDHAKASRVLFPEQVEQLIRQPDLPRSDLPSFCEYLLTRGVLTRFQADAIRDGREDELSFGGYPVIDVIGPCPGGREYRALHPSLRTPLVLRRLRTDRLPPGDSPVEFVNRARTLGMIGHPNLVHLLDAGAYRDELYLVFDPPTDSADLDSLTHEIGGAMPGFLAAEYGRAVASVLRLAHERGGVHGDVRPANLFVGPLVTKAGEDGIERRRPAPNAVLRLAELGTVPLRSGRITTPPEPAAAAFLPPELLSSGTCDPHGDIYGLGATLYFLLAGRPPFTGSPAEVLASVRSAQPTPLASLRPDLPPELADLITQMMSKDPQKRPLTMADVEATLVRFCRPASVQSEEVPDGTPASSSAFASLGAAPADETADEWGVGSGTFSADAAPRRRPMTEEQRRRNRMLLILGGLLHLTAAALIVAWILGAFDSGPEPERAPVKKDPAPIKKKKAVAPIDDDR